MTFCHSDGVGFCGNHTLGEWPRSLRLPGAITSCLMGSPSTSRVNDTPCCSALMPARRMSPWPVWHRSRPRSSGSPCFKASQTKPAIPLKGLSLMGIRGSGVPAESFFLVSPCSSACAMRRGSSITISATSTGARVEESKPSSIWPAGSSTSTPKRNSASGLGCGEEEGKPCGMGS